MGPVTQACGAGRVLARSLFSAEGDPRAPVLLPVRRRSDSLPSAAPQGRQLVTRTTMARRLSLVSDESLHKA